jgi:hypothetical protein
MTKAPDAPITAALASLVDSIISAYHTTRLKDVTVSQHVLAHASVQLGFKHLTALVVAAPLSRAVLRSAPSKKAPATLKSYGAGPPLRSLPPYAR